MMVHLYTPLQKRLLCLPAQSQACGGDGTKWGVTGPQQDWYLLVCVKRSTVQTLQIPYSELFMRTFLTKLSDADSMRVAPLIGSGVTAEQHVA